MNNYTLILFYITIFLSSCSSAGDSEPDTSQTPDPKPEGTITDVKDPDDIDYWDDATLVWSDEFEGTSISEENWTFETGGNGWGNNELQNYRAAGNTEVSDGILKITAKRNDDNTIEGAFTSARLNSKKAFKFGRMEIRAKLPEHKGNGSWPALWMLGSNIQTVGWPACGEIDMMEYVSFKPTKPPCTRSAGVFYSGLKVLPSLTLV
jgi:beta-glucanase (GH16 family)